MWAPAQTGFPEGVQAHPSQASAPRRGRPAPTLLHHMLTDAAARLRGGLTGPGCRWSCCPQSQPAEVGQDLGGRTEPPPPTQLPSVISRLPQLRSSALHVLEGPPSSAVLQVSSRLFTALLGMGLPSHFTDGEPEAAVGRVHGSLVRHARTDPALSKDVLRRPPKPLAVLLWGPGAEGEGSLMALDWAGEDVAGTPGPLGP